MSNEKLIEAIQTGTADEICYEAEDLANEDRGELAFLIDVVQILTEAIVAARAKPEDTMVVWLPWNASGIHFGGVSNTEKNAKERCFQHGISQKNICRVTITREKS